MNVSEIIANFQRRGIQLAADGDKLRFHPPGAVTADDIAIIRCHKTELLTALAAPGLIDDLANAGLLHPAGTITTADGRRVWQHPDFRPDAENRTAAVWPPALRDLIEWFGENSPRIASEPPFRAGWVFAPWPNRLVARLRAEISQGPFIGMRASDLRAELAQLRDYFTTEGSGAE